MSAQTAAFFAALDAYIQHFRNAPPDAFINDYTRTLQQKVDAMNNAVSTNTRIVA